MDMVWKFDETDLIFRWSSGSAYAISSSQGSSYLRFSGSIKVHLITDYIGQTLFKRRKSKHGDIFRESVITSQKADWVCVGKQAA